MSMTSVISGLITSTGSAPSSGRVWTNTNFVFDGNSLTYGQGSTTPATDAYPAQLKLLAPFNNASITFTNVGISGRTTQQLTSEAPTKVDVLLSGSKTNVLIMFEGINDLYNNCLTASAAYSNLQTYVAARKLAGWKVWVGGTTQRQVGIAPGNACGGTAAALEAESDAYNALVAAGWASFADGYINLRSDSTLNANPTYMADNIHLNTLGYGRLAQVFKTYLTA